MEIIEMYSNLIIKPLEQEVEKLRFAVYEKKFSLTKNQDRKLLERTEEVLSNAYEGFQLLVDDELIFSRKLVKEIDNI